MEKKIFLRNHSLKVLTPLRDKRFSKEVCGGGVNTVGEENILKESFAGGVNTFTDHVKSRGRGSMAYSRELAASYRRGAGGGYRGEMHRRPDRRWT